MDKNLATRLTFGGTCKVTNEANLKSDNPTSFTASISGVSGVFNLFLGEMEYIDRADGYFAVNIMPNPQEVIRYCNLTSVVNWAKGTSIGTEVKLGEVPNNKELGFEYCTQWQGTSKYPIRISGRLFYKQNPKDLLDGLYVPPAQIAVVEDYTPANSEYEFTEEQFEAGEWIDDPTDEEAMLKGVGDEDQVPIDEIEVPDGPFDQPLARFDMDRIDDFDPTQYIHYIERKEDSQEGD